MEIIVPTAESDWDSTKASVERSWANRDPGLVLSDDVGPESGGKEEFYTDYEKEIYSPVTEEPALNEVQNWDTSLNTKDASGTGPGPLTSDNVSIGSESVQRIALPLYASKVWYTEQDTTRTSQNSEFIQHYTSPMKQNTEITEDMQRALNILGYDILLRDEWTTSLIYNVESGGSNYYGYGYSNTNVLDSHNLLGDNLLTADYVLQSIYRALGVNCLRTETYFYADKDLTVDFTPLAEKITVAMDKINQVQNRVDVFVTRANLGDYWDKAVADGVVSNYGVKVLNTIDGAYKPYAIKCDKEYIDTQTNITYPKGTWIEMDGPISSKKTSASDITERGARVDYNRTKTLTLAEFCVYVKKLMDIYGEEVMTEKEQEMLLVYYGTKLPYNLDSEEELEAIKYLMAKGIVSDSMYWNGDLTLKDMLVILSRVKDTGSRLTFKEIDLQYDESLLDAGYYPAQLSFVSETSVGVVSTTLNESYSYSNAEWFDYFIKMPKEVKAKDGNSINPRFISTNGEQEYSTTNIFLTKGINNNFTKISNENIDYNNIEVIGYENLSDGYEYLHFRVKTSVLFIKGTNTVNPDYVINNCIYINTENASDEPQRWLVDYRGGIFRNPVAKECDDDSAKYLVTWDCAKYYKNGTKYTVNTDVVDLSSYSLSLNDFDGLAEHNTCKSLVVSFNADSTVKDAYTYKINKGKSNNLGSKYMTFDQAGFGYSYCDYTRYTNGLAVSFARNPMLANKTSVAKALASAIPQYDIWFYILADKNNSSKLSTSIMIDGEEIVSKDKPKEVNKLSSGVNHGIEYLSYSNGKYYYVARGSNTEKGLSDMLKTSDGDSIAASYATGYVKQNNTFLVKATDLFDIVEATSDIYENGSITRINDDVVCVSFDVKGADYLAQITHTIYMNEPLKLLSVNNMIYKIPDDEILFVDNTGIGGSYLLNYRAVLGWGSGYINTSTSQNGSLQLALSTQTANGNFAFAYKQYGMQNSYTGKSTPLVLIEKNGIPFSVPASAPNNYSSWFVYQSDTDGTYTIILKNSDRGASNSVINDLSPDSDIMQKYKDGNTWLHDIFGVTVGTGDPKTDDVLVSVYRLGIGEDDYEFSLNSDGSLDDNVDVSGKFYKDENLCTWAYVPVKKKTYGFSMAESRLGSKAESAGNQYGTQSADLTAMDVLKQDRELQEEYYSGAMILPYFWDSVVTTSDSVIDMSCNIHDGKPYGSIFVYTIDFDDGTDTDGMSNLQENGYLSFTELTKISCPQIVDGKIMYDTLPASNVINTTPANPLPLIMGIAPYKIGSTSEIKTTLRVAYGNYFYTYNPEGNSQRLIPAYDTTGGSGTVNQKTYLEITDAYMYIIGVTMTKQIGFMSSSGAAYKIDTEQRNILIDKTTCSALQELNQIGGVDWGAYTFDNLIHDIDNGMSILLIIVLNIIPRIGMFVFIILIGLSTVANMKPVRKFCDSVFDPYKLITLGHTTVYTINTKLLLISSIIGLAAFGLFMDGTIINLLTWLVQFVSAFVTR